MRTPNCTSHREPKNLSQHVAAHSGARLLRHVRAMACLALAWLVATVPAAMGQYTRYAFSNFAGQVGGPGSTDGAGGAGRFNFQSGTAVDGAGNVFVVDTGNHTIRKVTAAGAVSTYAGSAGYSGSVDGTGSSALFNNPQGIAVDSNGVLYVADTGNHTIRKITPSADIPPRGVVTTLAGVAGVSGSTNGTGIAATFYLPSGVAVDSVTGNVFVADTRNNTIRRITPAGLVSTLAGSVGNVGSTDAPAGPGSAARFNNPMGVAVDTAGIVYVADTGNHTIRRITPAGFVTTLTGTTGISGSRDGVSVGATGTAVGATTTATGYPIGSMVITTSGTGSGSILAGDIVTFAGDPNRYTVTTTTLDVTGGGGGSFFSIAPPGLIQAIPAAATAITVVSSAQFNSPQGVAVDASGAIYVADSGNHIIRRSTAAGVVTTLAGTAGISGPSDGTGAAARFYRPGGLAVDAAGANVHVADTFNFTIRSLVTATGVVTTLAGVSGGTGFSDGGGTAARFNDPQGVVVDAAGNTYVVDRGNHTIRRISPAGVVDTFAGSAGNPGSTNGTGTAARFSSPSGLAISPAGSPVPGNLYVADTGNHIIRMIDPATGLVSTLVGVAGNPGSRDGLSVAATGTATGAFTSNVGHAIGTTRIATQKTGTGTIKPGDNITVAGDTTRYTVIAGGGTSAVQGGTSTNAVLTGNPVAGTTSLGTNGAGSINTGDFIIIAGDSGRYLVTSGTLNVANSAIEIAAPGLNTSPAAGNSSITVVGSSFVIADPGLVKAIPALNIPITLDSTARINSPQGVAADAAGNVYVADTGNNTIRLVTPAGAVTTFTGTTGSAGSRDGLPAFSKGTAAGAYTINAGFPAGSTLIITSATDGSGTILAGDAVSFAGDPNGYIVTSSTSDVRGGTAAGATTNATGYAVGSTFIALSGASGTGTILAGSFITFAGDAQPYFVITGTNNVAAAGSFIVLASTGLTKAIPASSTAITLVGSTFTIAAPGLGRAIPAAKTAISLVTAAQFNSPQGMAVDVAGNLYVADTFNNTIRKITPTGLVTTLAGSSGSGGSAGTQDGTGTEALFKNPRSVAVDAFGNVYVADTGNYTIRKISAGGVVSTIGGGPEILGSADGAGIFARFYEPSGVALDSANNIFVADSRNNRISRGVPFLAFGKKGNTDMNNDGVDDLIFQNNAGQIYQWYMNGVGGAYTVGFIYAGILGEWRVMGIADMNADGNADIVFQNNFGQIYVWYMNGRGGFISRSFISTGGLGDWRIVGIADMNGDGKPDLIFQNTVGQVYLWTLNGNGGVISRGYLYGGSLPDWRLVSVSDVNNDGSADLVFQNTVGQIYVWHLNGTGANINFGTLAGINSFGYLYGGSLGEWRLMAIADMDADGIGDLVFQNNAGQVYVWYLDGSGASIDFPTRAGLKGFGFLYTGALGDWRIH